MIQVQTELAVADNTGAKIAECIKVLGGSKRRFASIGDIIIVSIKDAIPRGKVKKGETLWEISNEMYLIPFWLLNYYNLEQDIYSLAVGDSIVIPIIKKIK